MQGLSLTPKQKAVLDYIFEFAEENGYAPSQPEIAEHFGFKSLGTVQNYLVRLQRQGALEKTWNSRRGIQVKNPNHNNTHAVSRAGFLSLPLAGSVAAGRPIEAISQGDPIDVPFSLFKETRDPETLAEEHFVLRVKGDSMIEDGIFEGDLVIVRRQSQAENGQTVVALINNEATIKRLHRSHTKGLDRIELHPANPNYEPLVIESLTDSPHSPPDFHIEGVMVGLIRSLAT